ncbi:MAG TPA: DUF2520 domain-containing protein [Myxococcales bacterium]|jgi:predicted short-subunit dehydrogenase-like oxidoreductase (DUF2520 family)|nr:DUF2520 domain-containing protein [Myxococcales bacterium]
MNELRTAAVLGAGAVGSALLRELPKAGVRVVARWTRSSEKQLPKLDAELVLLAVSDGAVTELCDQLQPRRGQLVVHLAGALPLTALRGAQEQGARTGSMHPLRAITKGDDFRGAYTGIAGSTATARAQLTALSRRLGMKPLNIPDRSRALYHAAAVLAAPAQVALFSEAVRAFQKATGARERDARAALLPLALGALGKLSKSLPAAALTGPAARGDLRTIAAHREVLPKDLLALYDELTRVALGLKR